VWNHKIYMVGAMTGNYPKEPPMARVQTYDPAKDVWSKGDEIPMARRRGGAGTVVYNHKIYMACGITLGHTSGTCNWFDEYDPATGTWSQLPDAPHIRDHFHAVVVNDKLYCIGGRNTSYRNPTNPKQSDLFGAVERAVDVYEFKTGTWSTLANPLPYGSAAGGTAVMGDVIIYFGGETAEAAIDRTQALDTRTGNWSQLAPMKQGRHGSQAVVYQNRIYISAGSPNRGGGRVTSTEMFSCTKAPL
jgi:N-acetylneuraminic acid mutarotase